MEGGKNNQMFELVKISCADAAVIDKLAVLLYSKANPGVKMLNK